MKGQQRCSLSEIHWLFELHLISSHKCKNDGHETKSIGKLVESKIVKNYFSPGAKIYPRLYNPYFMTVEVH